MAEWALAVLGGAGASLTADAIKWASNKLRHAPPTDRLLTAIAEIDRSASDAEQQLGAVVMREYGIGGAGGATVLSGGVHHNVDARGGDGGHGTRQGGAGGALHVGPGTYVGGTFIGGRGGDGGPRKG